MRHQGLIWLAILGCCMVAPALGQIAHKFDDEGVAAACIDRGTEAYKKGDFTTALESFGRVCREFSGTGSYGIAQFNVGMILQEQRKYDEAIAEYSKLFPSRVNDLDSTGKLMSPYRNYRNSAAKQIARCYQSKNDFAKALAWVEAADTKYVAASFCGNCMAAEHVTIKAWQAELLDRLGRADDALQLIEPLVFHGDLLASCPVNAAVLLVDIHDRRHQLDELEAKLATAMQKNKADQDELSTKFNFPPRSPPYDGGTSGTAIAGAAIGICRLREAGAPAPLWRIIDRANTSLFHGLFGRDSLHAPNWKVQKACAALESMPEKTIPLLAPYLERPSMQQGWALVLLARMKAPNLWPQLKAACSTLDATPEGIDRQHLGELYFDLCYSLARLGTDEAKAILESHSKPQSDIDPVANAVRRVSEVMP